MEVRRSQVDLKSEIINLKSLVVTAMMRHAREVAPDECCGLLLARGDEIVEAVPARNIAEQPAVRFVIDPQDHFSARREARTRGLEVVGFYHSHPRSPAQPSARDRDEFAYPGHLYAIVSLRSEPAEVSLFRFDAGNFQRVPFVTVG
jgi:proteasome lid subunit RPN8/RPN11